MKLALTLSHQEIIEILTKHLREKIGNMDVGEVTLYVKSTDNFRLKTYERAAAIVLNDVASEEVSTSLKDSGTPPPELEGRSTAS